MRGRDRHNSRAQEQQEPTFVQKHFGGGENSDLPASTIGPLELALLRNAVDYGTYVEGHGGSVRLSTTNLPGSNAPRDVAYHPTAKKFVLCQDGQIYIGDPTLGVWRLILTYTSGSVSQSSSGVAGDTTNALFAMELTNSSASNTDSNVSIDPYHGTLYWSLTNTGSTRTLNIYKNSAKTQLVATGTRVNDGFMSLLEANSSGLFGSVTITYTVDDVDSGNTITLLITRPDVTDLSASLKPFGTNVIAFVGAAGALAYSRTLLIDLASEVYYRLNTPVPQYAITGSGTESAATPYGYRFLYTFCRITGGVDRVAGTLVQESGSNQGTIVDFGEFWVANPIDATHALSFYMSQGGALNAQASLGFVPAEHWTHFGIYRTKDIGVNGIDPSTGAGNNSEIYTWIGDMSIASLLFSTTKIDEKVQAAFGAGFGLRTRFWQAIPNGDLGCIVNDFLFAGMRANAKVYYQQLLKPENMGYYRPDAQFMVFDDGVQILAESSEQLAVICSRQTWTVNPKVFKNIDPVSSVFTITNRFPASRTIGVTDYGSFQHIEGGGFIARCSDASVRIWDGDSWGQDLGEKRVRKTLLNMVEGSASGYSKNAYYLWYRTASGTAYNDKCLRLGLGGDAGFGWSEISRATWLFPYPRVGAIVILDAKGLARLMVLDYATGQFFWIETFTNTDAGFTRAWKDVENVGGGTNIAATIRFRELVGRVEGNTLYHEESHTYLRPAVPADGYLTGFQIAMNWYADGAATPAGGLTNAPKAGDIQIAKVITGQRLQPEIVTTASKFQLLGMDATYQDQDNASIGAEFTDTDEAAYQLALASNLKHWLGRPKARLNRATGLSYTLTGTAPSLVTGPDGKSYGLSFPVGASYAKADTTAYTAFTFMFWIKGFTVANRVFEFAGTTFYVKFDSATVLNVNGTTIAVATIAAGWHHFALVRSGSTVTVYKNGALVGTLTKAGTCGGASLTLNPDAVALQVDDFRVYNAVKAAAAIAYYYDDVINNAGNLVEPLA